MFPASGYVTARANPVATAASTAFPPRRRISTPASAASLLLLATIACGANAGCADPGGKRHVDGNTAGTRAGTAGPLEPWNGAAAATQIETVVIAPMRASFLFRRTLLWTTIYSKRVVLIASYRRTVRVPNPILNDKRSEGMLLVLLAPFGRSFRSWRPIV